MPLALIPSTLLAASAAWLPAPPPGAPTSIAERSERVLLGTERGLYHEDRLGWTIVLLRGPVHGLASSGAGMLIASASGLYDWPAGPGEPQPVALGAGARVRGVAVDEAGGAWVATDVGLYRRPWGASHFRRLSKIPAGEVRAVYALGPGVWVSRSGSLWKGSSNGDFQEILKGLDEGYWELNGAAGKRGQLLLSVPRGLWRVGGRRTSVPPPIGPSRLEPPRFELPRFERLGVGELRGVRALGDQLWVASERGLYRLEMGPGHSGARTRLAPELATEVSAVGIGSRGLLVAGPRGVAVIPTLLRPPGRGLEATPPEEPGVRTLQRAVLSYLELSPRRVRELDERARRAAFYPEVRATFSVDRDRTVDRDHDQSFSAGDVRDLFDRSRSADTRAAFEIRLTWDLTKRADPEHALEISRERRQLIELRDQILERVNRLYFERLRLRGRLATLSLAAAEERSDVQLRIRELSAHLDAWTGGLFSGLGSAPQPSRRRSR